MEEKYLEKIPTWLIAISFFGLFALLTFSFFFDKAFEIAGVKFGVVGPERDDEFVQSVLSKMKSDPKLISMIAAAVDPSNGLKHGSAIQALNGTIGFSRTGKHGLDRNGSLYDNNGEGATVSECVPFDPPFKSPPKVTIGLSLIDMGSETTTRLRVNKSIITTNELCIEAHTWEGSRVWTFRIDWLAVGES